MGIMVTNLGSRVDVFGVDKRQIWEIRWTVMGGFICG